MTASRVTLQSALDDLAHIFGDDDFAYNVGRQVTCSEAETIAEALRVAGHTRQADAWVRGHADADTQFDQHYGLATTATDA